MKLDKRMVNRLLSLSDEQLGSVIQGIASEAGIDPPALGLTPDAIQRLRQALGMAQEEDVAKMGEILDSYRKGSKKQ